MIHALFSREFLAQHWAPMVVASLLAIALGTVIYRLIAGTLRGAILAVRRPKQLGESGAAAAEFVITVIPFMLMLTALMQLALASMGRVLVSYAAFCAARAAMVFVPMDSGQASQVGGSGSSNGGGENANSIGTGGNTLSDFTSSHKATLMRNAAAYALIAASPSIDVVAGDIANNWQSYLQQRLAHGLDPLTYLKNVLGDTSGIPSGLLTGLADKLQQATAGGLNTTAQKQAAAQQVDQWIEGAAPGNDNSGLRTQLQNIANNYINNPPGNGSPGGQLTDLLSNTVSSTLSGPLQKFSDSITSSISGALGTIGTSGSDGYAVDRALDAGFGAGTDGAGGAILRSLRKLVYARIGTAVTLLDDKGNYKTQFAWNEAIHVRVTYLFYCQIPLANRFAGHAFYNLDSGNVADLGTGPMNGFTDIGLPGHFMTLTADHVVTNQGTPN